MELRGSCLLDGVIVEATSHLDPVATNTQKAFHMVLENLNLHTWVLPGMSLDGEVLSWNILLRLECLWHTSIRRKTKENGRVLERCSVDNGLEFTLCSRRRWRIVFGAVHSETTGAYYCERL